MRGALRSSCPHKPCQRHRSWSPTDPARSNSVNLADRSPKTIARCKGAATRKRGKHLVRDSSEELCGVRNRKTIMKSAQRRLSWPRQDLRDLKKATGRNQPRWRSRRKGTSHLNKGVTVQFSLRPLLATGSQCRVTEEPPPQIVTHTYIKTARQSLLRSTCVAYAARAATF